MRKRLNLYLFVVMAMMTVCCRDTARSNEFTKKIYKPSYAVGFEITGIDDGQSTILKVLNPWQGAENTEKLLFIARNNEKVPEGFQGQTVRAGAKRIICMSSSYIAMLDALGEVKRVTGVSGKDYISNKYIASHQDTIGDIGYEGNINYELLVSLHPDIVLLYGVNAASSIETKLQELNIPYAYMGEYLEESPLGKAEWMMAIAEIIDKREEGEFFFNAIPKRYNTLKNIAKSAKNRPTVMLNVPYGDNWFMPSTQSFQIQLIRDAGADFIYKKNTGNTSVPIDIEEAYLLASQADFWLNTNTINTLHELKRQLPKFTDIPSVQKHRVYNNTKQTNASGGNDYWESGVVNPDIILRDMILLFHPGLIDDNTGLYYYQKLN